MGKRERKWPECEDRSGELCTSQEQYLMMAEAAVAKVAWVVWSQVAERSLLLSLVALR